MLLGDDELAAALIAVRCYLEEETPPADGQRPTAARGAWRAAAVLDGQGLAPARNGAGSTWATAERAGRECRWSTGIVGG